MEIRYFKDKDGSLWYSINDIEHYLYENKIISDKRISHLMRAFMASHIKKTNSHLGWHQTIQVEIFDEFYNWVVFDQITKMVLKKDRQRLYDSKFLWVIDDNREDALKKSKYPFRKVKLSLK